MAASEIANYEQQVYAGVLGKVIGVYLARPVEGWEQQRLVEKWGLIDHYIAADRGVPLVVPDDDISGTFTFVRALEDSGRYADTTPDFFGKTWLNYLIEGKTILWWGGLGVSTEHTAYLRLKHGIPSPRSGSIALNGRVVAEQIGAQIFIDAFGLVAPGDPQLAARLARPAAQVSHDGEAVNAAMVVAAMVSAAFVEKDMQRLLDIGVSVIARNSLVGQLHRDVRSWCRQDGDWHRTYDRIAGKYGYDSYGGGCHVIPNHALMVMAWSYALDDFRRALAIVTTAGWDTDCNAANVGTVMGLVAGLDGISKDYDFRGPFADRMLLPTAEGSRHVSDCLQEALHIARIGRKIMGWPELEAPKGGAWHHFILPGSRHGYMVERTDQGMPGTGAVANVAGPNGTRVMEIAYQEAAPNHPVRVSTPVLAEPVGYGYGIVGTPKVYAGQVVTLEGVARKCESQASIRLFARCLAADGDGSQVTGTKLVYGEPVQLKAGSPFALTLPVPGDRGFPVKDIGVEITGGPSAAGSLFVNRVLFTGPPDIHIPDELPQKDGTVPGWVVDADRVVGRSGKTAPAMTYVGKDEGCGILATGNEDWTDYTVSVQLSIHCADTAGIIARYQGLERFIALVKTRDALKLLLNYYGETVLAEMPCIWEVDELHRLSLTVRGTTITASLDGKRVLTGEDTKLGRGGAGFRVDNGFAGFREIVITTAHA